MPLKVIQGHRGRYQSKARIQLPIPILYCFGVIAAYCSNFGDIEFLSPFCGA